MKRIIALALAFIIAALMVTPAFASTPDDAQVEIIVINEVIRDDVVWDDFIFHRDYMILHINGRPSSPISLRFEDGFSFANLREAAYALSADVEWDGENQVVYWTPDGRGHIVLAIYFEKAGGFNDDGTVWVPEGFVWELFFMTMDRGGGFWPTVRTDIPYAAPVVRTTYHGQMAVELIRFMNDNLYNRVPFSYRELEAALWIRDQLIEMGYDEDAVYIQTFSIDDLGQNMFAGGSLGMYHQFNAFDPDLRLTFDEALDAIVEMTIQQEHEWMASMAEHMGITLEEARAMFAENFGLFVDILDKFLEASARESAPWRLEMANVFGLFDPNTIFRPMSQNVILTVPGQSERTIIVTAHYCTVMVPGASDNASGTSLLLESAYRLRYVDNYFTIKYVFMSAEEIGILGAFYYVESLTTAQRNNIVLNINADVLFEGPYFFFGSGIREQGWWLQDNEISLLVAQVAEMVNDTYGTVLINAQPLAEMPSDQLAFLHNGHTVVSLVGLARLGAEGYEDFPAWDMYPGFGASVVHTQFDDYHFINATWPNKIGDAMWTFSLFLEYLLAAEFDYHSLQEIRQPGFGPIEPPLGVDVSGHPLVGTWSWDDNPEWTFVFNPDGTGTRGLPGYTADFTWYADEFTLFINMDGSHITEFWQLFGLEDDALILGLQWRSMFYTRQ